MVTRSRLWPWEKWLFLVVEGRRKPRNAYPLLDNSKKPNAGNGKHGAHPSQPKCFHADVKVDQGGTTRCSIQRAKMTDALRIKLFMLKQPASQRERCRTVHIPVSIHSAEETW